MKNFVTITKLLLSYMIITIAVLFVFEYSRMRETQSTMIMFSRIAGNYALSASQDVGRLTNVNRIGRVSCMYDKDEYAEYLSSLGQSATDTGDSSLQFAYELLLMDYNRAVSSAFGSNNLDAYLKYTPMSFNLPYMSKRMLEDCYSEAMLQMVSNYKCNGKPSIFVPTSSSHGFNMSNASARVVTIESSGYYGGGNTLAFDCVPMTKELMRSIYGSEDYYDSKIKNVFSQLDPTMYNDPRFVAFLSGLTSEDFDSNSVHIPIYRITFNTPYFYITGSSILSFGRPKLFFGTDMTVVSRLISGEDVNAYSDNRVRGNIVGSGYYSGAKYYKDGVINEGQLMVHLDNFNVSSEFEYTLLS